MANSAADAGHSEAEIRRKLIAGWTDPGGDKHAPVVDVMVAVGPNFIYTVALPVTLWFLDRDLSQLGFDLRGLGFDARPVPAVPTRCCSSTPGASFGRSTAPP
jgi:type I restriction enzyme M protein